MSFGWNGNGKMRLRLIKIPLLIIKVAIMSNEELIRYGLNHKDETVKELAERFEHYRKVVSRFVGSETPITITQTSGQRTPMYAHKY